MPSQGKKHFDQVHLKIKSEKRFECDLCSFKTYHKSHLIDHIESRHVGNKYNCKQCDAEFNNQGSLNYHIRSKHRINSCKICNESFNSYYSILIKYQTLNFKISQ